MTSQTREKLKKSKESRAWVSSRGQDHVNSVYVRWNVFFFLLLWGTSRNCWSFNKNKRWRGQISRDRRRSKENIFAMGISSEKRVGKWANSNPEQKRNTFFFFFIFFFTFYLISLILLWLWGAQTHRFSRGNTSCSSKFQQEFFFVLTKSSL